MKSSLKYPYPLLQLRSTLVLLGEGCSQLLTDEDLHCFTVDLPAQLTLCTMALQKEGLRRAAWVLALSMRKQAESGGRCQLLPGCRARTAPPLTTHSSGSPAFPPLSPSAAFVSLLF